MSLADDLDELASLHRRGVLNDDEFRSAKERLLGTSSSEPRVGAYGAAKGADEREEHVANASARAQLEDPQDSSSRPPRWVLLSLLALMGILIVGAIAKANWRTADNPRELSTLADRDDEASGMRSSDAYPEFSRCRDVVTTGLLLDVEDLFSGNQGTSRGFEVVAREYGFSSDITNGFGHIMGLPMRRALDDGVRAGQEMAGPLATAFCGTEFDGPSGLVENARQILRTEYDVSNY